MSTNYVYFQPKVSPGKLASGSVTASYASLLEAKGHVVQLFFSNTLDGDIVISLDGGTTDWMYLPAGHDVAIDLAANNMVFSGDIQVKTDGSASTSGYIACSAITRE